MPPVTGSRVPSLPVFGSSADSAAPFLLEDEMYAAGAARNIEDWIDVVAETY